MNTQMKMELEWHQYLASLELPYVRGLAHPGDDPARDAELRAIASSLEVPCILDKLLHV
jgi:hypothetical protein